MTFDDLVFEENTSLKEFPPLISTFEEIPLRHEQARVFFSNGFGASIIIGPYTHGGKKGLFELAVLVGVEDKWTITYDTSITNDVLGYLTKSTVTELLGKVEALQ